MSLTLNCRALADRRIAATVLPGALPAQVLVFLDDGAPPGVAVS